VCFTFAKGTPSDYIGIRRERVDHLLDKGEPWWQCRFGSREFLQRLKNETSFNVFCHHASYVEDHKSPDFPVLHALENNTLNLPDVLQALRNKGCDRIVLTGTIYENDEGADNCSNEAFSAYGLSKGLTYQCFRYYCLQAGMRLGKFVIPNPFGPYEKENSFTSYLARSWQAGEVPIVNTPEYVRDNIHVSLLTSVYVRFVEALPHTGDALIHCAPSGYVEKQSDFTERFAKALRPRLGVPCRYVAEKQSEFPQSRVRYNKGSDIQQGCDWDEEASWDGLSDFYQEQFTSANPVSWS